METEDQQFRVTEDYPGIVVHDGRVSGSITLGPTRFPLWCFIQTMADAGYAAAAESYPSLSEYASAQEIGEFLYFLLEQRTDFGRLLCVLADVERREREARNCEHSLLPWYAHQENVDRVRTALHNCLKNLDSLASREWDYIIMRNLGRLP